MLISLYTGAPFHQGIRDGQDAFETLVYEADVAASYSHPSRLVDDPEHTQNMNLWLELLRFRKRLHGLSGIRDVWSGMMQRHLCLPVTGPTADALWSVFMDAAFADPSFLNDIYNHALHIRQTKNLLRPNLYRDIVGGWFRRAPSSTIFWHQRMRADAMMPAQPALAIFDFALRSRDADRAFLKFKAIYTETQASAMYDICMPAVVDVCEYAAALRWHNFFVKHGDRPTSATQSDPIIQHLQLYARDHKSQLGQQQYADLRPYPPTHPDLPVLSRESMNTIVGDVHGIRQKNIGDAFCARLFATGAFSIDLVVNGLRMIGLETIGPLALREIAARSQDPSDYLTVLHSLNSAGVKIVDSTFSRALKKFAEENNQDYFKVVVTSDQHPDTYDNIELQKRLFHSFLAAEKLREAHATLAILAMAQPHPDNYMWNFLLQTYCRDADRRSVMQILHDMRLKSIPLSGASLSVIFETSLLPRKKGQKPMYQKGHSRDLDFVTNVFLTALRSGKNLDPRRFREILRRYGMTNRLVSLERLCLWLATWYTPLLQNEVTSLLRSPDQIQPDKLRTFSHSRQLGLSRLSRPLSQIFTAPLLRALVAWAFLGSAPPLNAERELNINSRLPKTSRVEDASESIVRPESWANGIALVRKLQRYGVSIHRAEIGREVRLRLWMLFGPGRSANKHNRLAARRNERSLYYYVKHIDEVWGDNFFRLPPGWLNERTPEVEIRRAIFGHRRKSNYHIDGYKKTTTRR